ncbi:hypothetical protein [Alkalibacterium sp.]|nr:MAG: hypothetical protein EA249_08860 [Alkalibacterium sp.]
MQAYIRDDLKLIFKQESDLIFTLGRSIDLRYKSNLIIILLTLSATALGWLFTDDGVVGLYLGGGVFLSWALSRELDPAHTLSAFKAAGLVFFTIFSPDSFQPVLVFWLLLLMRLINGITGKKLTLIDLLSTLAFTGFLSFTRENSLYLLIFVLTTVSLVTIGERSKSVLIVGGLALLLLAGQIVIMDSLNFVSLNEIDFLMGSLLALTLLSVPFFRQLSQTAIEDDKGETVDSIRVFSGQLLYSAAIILLTLTGSLTFNDQLIYLAVVSGILIHFVQVNLLKID